MPQSTLCSLTLHGKSLCKNKARASGGGGGGLGANNMHPLSWGEGVAEPENMQKLLLIDLGRKSFESSYHLNVFSFPRSYIHSLFFGDSAIILF